MLNKKPELYLSYKFVSVDDPIQWRVHFDHMRTGHKRFAKLIQGTASLQHELVNLDDSMEAIPWKFGLRSENNEKICIPIQHAGEP